jgi:hypothetical protein
MLTVISANKVSDSALSDSLAVANSGVGVGVGVGTASVCIWPPIAENDSIMSNVNAAQIARIFFIRFLLNGGFVRTIDARIQDPPDKELSEVILAS